MTSSPRQASFNVTLCKGSFLCQGFSGSYKAKPLLFKVLLIISGAFLAIQMVAAQTVAIDSLKKVIAAPANQIKGTLADTARMQTLLELGNKLSYYNIDSSNKTIREAFGIAARLNNAGGMADAYAYLGSNFYYQDVLDSAQAYFNGSILFYKKDKRPDSKMSIATIRSEIADIWVNKGDYQPAIKVYLNVIDTLKRFDSTQYSGIGNLYLAIGAVYRNLQEYQKALDYDLLGVIELKKDKNKPGVSSMGQLHVVSNLISLDRYDEAEKVIREVENTAIQLGSDKLLLDAYGNWGGLYDAKNDPGAAIRMYDKAYKLAVKTKDLYSQGTCLMQIGLIYSTPGSTVYNNQLSISYLQRALALEKGLGNKHKESQLLRALASVSTQLGHNEVATRYYSQYLHLSDSLNEADTKIKINDLETKYQTRKKADSLEVMRKDAALKSLQLAKNKSVNTGLIISCVLLLLLVGAFYRNYKRKNQLLKQARQLHAQKIQELEKQRQMVAMQSVIKGQEAERSRLARDLHDGVGGLLSGVKLSLSNMKGNVFLSEKSVQAVASVIDQLDASIRELRSVSHNMMPEALIKYGLKEALENYADNIMESGKLQIQLQTFGMENRMPQDTEIVIYRIVQELLGNAIKHAQASEILIQLVKEASRFTLTVEDNGQGFQENRIDSSGAGLANIKARAAYLDGTVDIHSVPGQGSSITVEGSCAEEG